MVNRITGTSSIAPTQSSVLEEDSTLKSTNTRSTIAMPISTMGLALAKEQYRSNKSQQPRPSVLILTGGTGNGHRCPAQAIKQAFDNKKSGLVDYHYYDIKMDAINRDWKHDVKFKLTDRFGVLNSITHKQNNSKRQWLRDKIMQSLVDSTPDAIYVNHYDISHQLGKVMRNMELDTNVIIASADHGAIHADWYPKTLTIKQSKHLFLVPDLNQTEKSVKSDATADALKRGVPAERIRFEGYPVRHEFIEAASKSRNECRSELSINLPEGKSKILLGMVGSGHWVKSFGDLIIEARKSKLLEDTHIIIIAGGSADLKRTLVDELGDTIDVRGTCEAREVALLMRSADVVATKAGGSSLHECNAVQTPALIYMALSGVESENAKHAVEQGTGVLATDPKKFAAVASGLLGDAEKRKQIEREQLKHYDSKSSYKIAGLLESQAIEAFKDWAG